MESVDIPGCTRTAYVTVGALGTDASHPVVYVTICITQVHREQMHREGQSDQETKQVTVE